MGLSVWKLINMGPSGVGTYQYMGSIGVMA